MVLPKTYREGLEWLGSVRLCPGIELDLRADCLCSLTDETSGSGQRTQEIVWDRRLASVHISFGGLLNVV